MYIEGRLKTRKWSDDKGQERYTTEIICSDFTFLTNKNENFEKLETKSQNINLSSNDSSIENQYNDNEPSDLDF